MCHPQNNLSESFSRQWTKRYKVYPAVSQRGEIGGGGKKNVHIALRNREPSVKSVSFSLPLPRIAL